MPQRSIRLSAELHDTIEAEAKRRGSPHSFTSVLLELARLSIDGGALQGERAVEAALSEAKRVVTPEQADPGSLVPSSEGDRSATPPRAPVPSREVDAAALARQKRLNDAKSKR